jgi:hypothetical protein
MLKRRLKTLFHREGRPQKIEELMRMTQDEWENLDWERIYTMLDARQRRFQAVIDADGERTRY